MDDCSSDDDIVLSEYTIRDKTRRMPSEMAEHLLEQFTMQDLRDGHELSKAGKTSKKRIRGVCIICSCTKILRGKKNYACIRASMTSKSVLLVYAKRQNDYPLLRRLISSSGKIWLHGHCWIKYSQNTRVSPIPRAIEENDSQTELDILNGLHKVAYAAVCNFVQDEIIDNGQSIALHDLTLQYKMVVFTMNEDEPVELDKYLDLHEMLLEDYGELITIEKCGELDYFVLHKNGVDCASVRPVATNVMWTYKQIKKVLLELYLEET